MANTSLQTGNSGWVGNIGLNQGGTELRITALRKSLSGLRVGDSDHAINAGYTPDNLRRFKRKAADVTVLHRQCEELQERYRENARLAEDLAEARQMAKEMEGASNPDEHRKPQATADAMLAFLIDHRPEAVTLFRGIDFHCPELIGALDRIQVAVPDSQPINDAMRLAEDVPKLQDENAALMSKIEDLERKREASDGLVKEANDCLDKLRIEKQESEKSLRDEGAMKDREIGRLTAEKDNLERVQKESDDSIQEVTNELDACSNTLARVQEELKISMDAAKLASDERDQAREDVRKLRLELEQANGLLTEANDRVAEESKALDDVRKKLEVARKDGERVPTLEGQVRVANTKVRELEADKSHLLEEGRKVKAERDRVERENSALEFNLNDAGQSERAARKELSDSMADVRKLDRKVESLEEEIKANKAQMERSEKAIAEMKGDLKSVEERENRYQTQRNILLKYKDKAEELEKELQVTKTELGQCQETLTSVQKESDASEADRGRYRKQRDVLLKLKDQADNELQTATAELKECRETLKEAQGSMTSKEEEVAVIIEEKRGLKEEKSRLTQTLDETLKELETARAECKSQEAEIDQLNSSYQERVEECALSSAALDTIRVDYKNVQASLRILMESLKLESKTKAVLEKQIEFLRGSRRELEGEIDGLRQGSIKKVGHMDLFLTGSDNSELHSSIGRLLDGKGQDALSLRSTWRPRWTLLPAWGAEPDETRSSVKVLLIELVAAGRYDDWGVKSKGFNVLRQLREVLVDDEGITAGMGELILKALCQVLKDKELCFMVRIAIWQNLWLLQKGWGSEPIDVSLQAGRDDLVQALALGDSLPTAQLGSAAYIQVDDLILLRPENEAGIVIADKEKFTLQWVAREYINLKFHRVIFTQTLLQDFTLELDKSQLGWAYINL